MEISPYVAAIIITLAGIPLHIILAKSPIIKKLDKRRFEIANFKPSNDTFSYDLRHQSDSLEHLGKITTKLSNNYRILIAVHGILLAFVISNKILMVFTSWYFVLWCGMILAVIIRSGRISLLLSDVAETSSDDVSKRAISASKRFFNIGLFLLVLNVVLLPSIFLLDEPGDLSALQENFHLNVLGASVALSTSFCLFYYMAFQFRDFEYEHGIRFSLFFIFVILIVGTFLYSISPTQITTLPIMGDVSVQVPFIVGALPIFGVLYTGILFVRLITTLPMLLPEKYRKLYVRLLG